MIFEDSCYIILHRDRSSLKDRTRNLLFVIKYIRSELDIPILVVEQDIKSNNKLYEILRENNVKYEFLYNPGLFNRSWGYNCAINIIKQNRLILADNDVILSNCKLIDCLMYLNYYDIVKPYNIMYDLPNTETTEIIEKNILPTVLNTYKQRIGMTIFSAMIAIKKNAFLQMGGYDERFEGWGGEDDEMTIHLWKYITFEGGGDRPNGKWSIDSDKQLVLDWNHWGQEKLKSTENGYHNNELQLIFTFLTENHHES